MKTFIRASIIRALRTAAQAAVAMMGTAAIMSEVNWLQVASGALLAGVLSILTSVATGLPECEGSEAEKEEE